VLTVVEKVILLQDVDIFSEVSTGQLASLAGIAEEKDLVQGEAVYHEQDPADAMYLVVEGRVRLHRADLEITVAGPGESFGTWALFDDEPRVSAATPLEDVHLLQLNKEDFIDLLADNVQITQGVLKALVNRVRGLLGRVGGGGS
jgi:CRP/FNR family cyclic AMP-dependent transcriptional regulator